MSTYDFQVLIEPDIDVGGANKLLALFGRAAARDYIDVYFIVQQTEIVFEKLIELAKRKGPGLQEFYPAWWLRQQTPKLKEWPTMLQPFDKEALVQYFMSTADHLMAGLAPDQNAFSIGYLCLTK